MMYRSSLFAVALTGLLAGFAGAKPPGGPTNPHGTGKEPTPIEREFHLPPTAEPRLTDPVPMLPAKRIKGEVLDSLRLALSCWKGL